MVTIKHKVTIKTKTPQEECAESVDVIKVTLKKKQVESSVVSGQEPLIEPKKDTSPLQQEQEKISNTGKIISGIIAAAAIIAGVYFFGIRDNNNSSDDKTVASTEVVAQNDGNTVKETTANSAAGEEGLPENSSEATTPANDSETSAENAKGAPTANESTSPSVQTDDKKTEEESAVTPSGPSVPLTASSASISEDVEENARRVIRGEFGNGQVRKDKLGAAYSEIQGKVNEMYRQGLVK